MLHVPAIAWDPQLSAYFRLLCMAQHSFTNLIPVRYECLLQRQQNRSKATMWLLYTNSSYSKVSKMLLDWWLYVACYYPKTPTDYPSTTRGMSVGPPVAVNIEFCGYLRFWALVLSELYGHSVPQTTFLVNKYLSLLRRIALIFQPTVKSRASDSQSKQCQNCISQLRKMCGY